MAALSPGVQHKSNKSGYGFRDKGKAQDNKVPPSKGQGLSKKGLKWAGAAAAGLLGGTGTGYKMGFLGRPKHGSRNHYDHKTASYEENQRLYYKEGQEFQNQSRWGAFAKAAAPAPTTSIFVMIGYVVSFFITAWIIHI
ncbi:hypothetical protein EXN66_Car017772 [Channa argus]|uniref:Uncharacterized protein n=1 Tax=Channa argus TaxID=215402 RepID=A0A6G1QI14_CHAAH|nr:hypothetical protein EXN66_Car017772 [Channa argus]